MYYCCCSAILKKKQYYPTTNGCCTVGPYAVPLTVRPGAARAGAAGVRRRLHAALAAGHLPAVQAALLRPVVEPEDLPAEDAVGLAPAGPVPPHALQALDQLPVMGGGRGRHGRGAWGGGVEWEEGRKVE